MWYGEEQFRPKLILSQIGLLQVLHYAIMGLVFFLCHVLFASDLTLDSFFDWQSVGFGNTHGLMIVVVSLLCAAMGSVLLLLIVRRAKKCADFAFTIYFLHAFLCTLYSGFPSSWPWWIMNVLCIIIMAVGGEQLCMRKELAEIYLPVLASDADDGTNTNGIEMN